MQKYYKAVKTTILSLVTLICISCSLQDSPRGYVDPKLQPFLDEFKREAMLRGINFETSFSIHFGNLKEKGVRALTVYSSHEIIIDSTCTDYRPFILLCHELGHTMGRVHDDSIIIINGKECVKSIMSTGYVVTFDENRKYYLDELFSKQ